MADFPAQASQKDGLGRMCKPHWTEYTRELRKAALARKALEADQKARAAKTPSVIDRLSHAAIAPGGTVTIKPVGGRKPKALKPESPKVRKARAVVAATESLGGKAYTDAIGSDEVQAALEVAGSRDGTPEPIAT